LRMSAISQDGCLPQNKNILTSMKPEIVDRYE